jgi:exosortase A
MNRQTLQFGLLGISFVAAFLPILSELMRVWSRDEDYSHGFFVIPIVLYLIWHKRDELGRVINKSGYWGTLAVIAGLCLVLLGTISEFATLKYLAFIFTIWGSVFYLFGWGVMRKSYWELGFMLFMIPIPASIYAQITLPLQTLTTKFTASLLFLLKIPAYREGNIIHLTNSTLEVVNACSGLRSLLSIVALAYLMGTLYFKKVSLRFIMLGVAIIIAIFVNIIRVSSIAASTYRGYPQLAEGLPHTLLGLLLFCFSFCFLLMTAKVLNWISQKE